MEFRVTRRQIPVGHGGFHVGSARFDQSPGPVADFTWIFDRGAKKRAKLDNILANNRILPAVVDWLFISHFDQDHVSGLNALLSATKINNVMVPYVDQHALVVTLLEQLKRKFIPHDFVQLASSPARFFHDRGVSNVFFLGSADERPAGLSPDAPRPSSEGPFDIDKSDTKFLTRFSARCLRFGKTPGDRRTSGNNTDKKAYWVEPGATFDVTVNSASILFVPFCEKLSHPASSALTHAVSKEVGASCRPSKTPGLRSFAYAIAEHARSEHNRKRLRAIFALHGGSSNRTSMSLLSIPKQTFTNDVTSYRFSADGYCWKYSDSDPYFAGWMSTGDAELADQNRFKNWLANYSPYLNGIEMLALPHHGSDRNVNSNLVVMARSAAFSAHVAKLPGGHSKKHPGHGIVRFLKTSGRDFFCVTDCPTTELICEYVARV